MRPLSELTTLRLGGPAGELVEARTEEALVDVVRDGGPDLLVLAGGSNVVVADAGVPGRVVLVATRGVTDLGDGRLEVQAGEPWDPFVADCVAKRLAGVECLSGIPGSVGATPIQNVGAYGQDVSQTIVSVRALDRGDGVVRALGAEECGFAYRTSRFKREAGRWVVLAVTFALAPGEESEPIRYPELARALGIEPGARAPLAEVRAAVLSLRRGKGMVIDPEDPDSVSVGSFFTNPILEPEAFAALEARVRERLGEDVAPPRFPEPDGRVKTSAAWLVERSGVGRGFGLPGPVAVSTKHTLALTNRGGATTEQLVELARRIAERVRDELGVELVPEPVFVGHAWAALAAGGAPPRPE